MDTLSKACLLMHKLHVTKIECFTLLLSKEIKITCTLLHANYSLRNEAVIEVSNVLLGTVQKDEHYPLRSAESDNSKN